MRRMAATLVAGLLAAGCGGGGSSPLATTPTPSGGGGDSARLVVLDSANFEALALATPRPSLVKFQSPT